MEDRFGNPGSAVYLQGHRSSYLNLGNSPLLKSPAGTISLWINVHGFVLAGKGYYSNPILMMRRVAGEDFNIALGIGYNPLNKRFGMQQSKDSLQEAAVFSNFEVKTYSWYHLVMTYDDQVLQLYINGEFQGQAIKGFKSVFWEGDSVLLGKCLGLKNERFTHAVVDDLRFFDTVLSAEQIENLYREPDPNRLHVIMRNVFKYAVFGFILLVTIVALAFFNRRKLKRQREYYELKHRIKELEVKVIRNQMNPHFVSNSLTAIQQLMYSRQNERAAEYLANFSFLMRKVLEYSEKPYIRLREELDIIKLNVDLEQLRFENKFQFMLELEEGIEPDTITIPSLITQPFIENAIWHGLLLLQDRQPTLKIRIYTDQGRLFIDIEDNGIGRNMAQSSIKHSKGIKLVSEKMESLNRHNGTADYSFRIVDLFDEEGKQAGTRVILNLSEVDPY